MQYKGFTVVELIVVIVILSVVAITALTQFLAINEDAEVAKTKSLAALFKQEVNFAKARWEIDRYGSSVANMPHYQDGTVDMNSFGFPVGTNKRVTNQGSVRNDLSIGRGSQGCVDLWNLFLTPAPTVTRRNRQDNGDFDYRAYRFSSGDNPTSPNVNDSCSYVLRKLGDTQGRNNAEVKFTYNSSNGKVTFEDNRP